jgi:predicted transposase YbfD/YdcC
MERAMAMMFDELTPRSRVAVLLKEFSQIDDDREPWRVAFPLAEVLLLLTCATIAECDDFDDIAAWGEHHLDLLRRFAEFHHGVPGARWLRTLVNRIDPILFGRIYTASSAVDWITSERSYPGQPRFRGIQTIVKIVNRTELADRCTLDVRHYISSAPRDIERLAEAARGHWGVESLHWQLDVTFKDDLSRYRTGNGAKNMAVVRRFALNLVRANKTKGSVKLRRKTAGWSPDFLLEILQIKSR